MQANTGIQPMLINKLNLGYVYHQFLNVSASYTHIKRMISLKYLQGDNNTIIQSYGNLNHGDYYTFTVTAQKQIGVW